MALQIQPCLFDLSGGDKLCDLAPLEPGSGNQAVTQRCSCFGKIARHHEGIGLIQCLRLTMTGTGLAQYSPKQLLHRRGRRQRGHAHQNVGKWAVPALRQCLLRDHEFHWAGRVGNTQLVLGIDLLQPLFLSSGHDNLTGRDAVIGDQLVLHLLEIQCLDSGAAWFRLNQYQRAQIRSPGTSLLIGQLVQGIAAANSVGQTLLPVGLGFQHHRQLDHFFRLQLGGGYAVQHVAGRALQIGRGRELHHPAGAEARQHVEGQLGAAVVRLIHHHERAAQTQHVGQRIRGRALAALTIGQQFITLAGGEIVKVMHQRTAGLVHLAALFFFHLKRLPRGDDDRGRGIQRGAGDALGFLQIQHRDRARLAQRGVIRVAAILQRLDGLLTNRLAGHQPQNHAVLAAQQVGVDPRHALGR